jgi:hypothetical protein
MIKRGKEWSWMNKLDYSNMKRKKRKTKRTFKVKVIRFFQNEVIVDWLMFLTFVSTIYLLIYLSTKT